MLNYLLDLIPIQCTWRDKITQVGRGSSCAFLSPLATCSSSYSSMFIQLQLLGNSCINFDIHLFWVLSRKKEERLLEITSTSTRCYRMHMVASSPNSSAILPSSLIISLSHTRPPSTVLAPNLTTVQPRA